MGYTLLRIALASMVGMLPIGPTQANGGQRELPRPNLQGMEHMAQVGAQGPSAPSTNSAPAGSATSKSSDENYKWLIKSSGDDYKWAIPSADKSAVSEKPAAPSEAKPNGDKKSTSYYRPANSYATNPDSDPPRYVRRLSQTGIEAFKDIHWLDIGFEFRTRYEMRHDDFRRVEAGFDNPFFLRSRAYLGIREILDPFRFAVEFQDSRVYNNRFPTTDQENNPGKRTTNESAGIGAPLLALILQAHRGGERSHAVAQLVGVPFSMPPGKATGHVMAIALEKLAQLLWQQKPVYSAHEQNNSRQDSVLHDRIKEISRKISPYLIAIQCEVAQRQPEIVGYENRVRVLGVERVGRLHATTCGKMPGNDRCPVFTQVSGVIDP